MRSKTSVKLSLHSWFIMIMVYLICYFKLSTHLQFTYPNHLSKKLFVQKLVFPSAMAPCAQSGIETGDQHFTRPSFPLQGWLCWTNDSTTGLPRPIKTVNHVFGHHGFKANHHYTLAAFGQFLNLQVDEDSYDSSRLKKMVIVSDGCSGQNWSHQIFGHLVRLINNYKTCPGRFFPELKELIVVKTVAGHGMFQSQITFHYSS